MYSAYDCHEKNSRFDDGANAVTIATDDFVGFGGFGGVSKPSSSLICVSISFWISPGTNNKRRLNIDLDARDYQNRERGL